MTLHTHDAPTTALVARLTDSAPLQDEVVLHVICAWCQTTMREGSIGALASHGICDACQARFEAGGGAE